MGDGQGDITLSDGMEWISLGEAARRLGVTRAAIYGRIERRTLATRPKGNRGLEVQWPPPPQRHHHRNGDIAMTVMGDTMVGADDMRNRLAKAEGEAAQLRQQVADLWVERDQLVERSAQTRERAAKAEGEANTLRDALADLSARLDRAEARLAMPWWKWLFG